MTNFVGTSFYIAPEIIDSRPYSFKADVWSLGIIFYELCALVPPFFGTFFQEVINKITHDKLSPLPDIYSEELREFIYWVLDKDITTRPDINDMIASKFFQDILKDNLEELGVYKMMRNHKSIL